MKGIHAVMGMNFHAFHGVLEVERELGQVFSVDAIVEFDMAPADDSPKAEPTVKDADVYEITRNVMMETKYKSVASLAGKIARDLLAECSRATNVTVSIKRKQIYISGSVDYAVAEVSCSRKDFEAEAKG
ncbi:MAG: dihydroneopterin aldolase [Synergistaceae bacterium]|jgi:dihydroneopterin aldolase|nr:dihydroneopterin aldolase [Synergistaceae bacterium]